jgi:hypothetical protein
MPNLNAIHQRQKLSSSSAFMDFGPFACPNSELTSETINACPTFSKTPLMEDSVSQGHYLHRTKHKTILVKQVRVLECATTVMITVTAMAINTFTPNIMNMVMGYHQSV